MSSRSSAAVAPPGRRWDRARVRVRRVARVAVVAGLAVLASGCIRFRADLALASDETVSGTIVVAVQSIVSTGLPTFGELPAPLRDHVRTEVYNQDGYVGSTLTLTRLPFDQFDDLIQRAGSIAQTNVANLPGLTDLSGLPGLPSGLPGASGSAAPSSAAPSSAPSSGGADASPTTGAPSGSTATELSIRRAGDKVEVSGSFFFPVLSFGTDTTTADVRLAITFPGEVTAANGVRDGRTVTWRFALGEVQPVTATAYLNGSPGGGWGRLGLFGGGGVLLVLAAAVAVVMARRRAVLAPAGAPAPGTDPADRDPATAPVAPDGEGQYEPAPAGVEFTGRRVLAHASTAALVPQPVVSQPVVSQPDVSQPGSESATGRPLAAAVTTTRQLAGTRVTEPTTGTNADHPAVPPAAPAHRDRPAVAATSSTSAGPTRRGGASAASADPGHPAAPPVRPPQQDSPAGAGPMRLQPTGSPPAAGPAPARPAARDPALGHPSGRPEQPLHQDRPAARHLAGTPAGSQERQRAADSSPGRPAPRPPSDPAEPGGSGRHATRDPGSRSPASRSPDLRPADLRSADSSDSRPAPAAARASHAPLAAGSAAAGSGAERAGGKPSRLVASGPAAARATASGATAPAPSAPPRREEAYRAALPEYPIRPAGSSPDAVELGGDGPVAPGASPPAPPLGGRPHGPAAKPAGAASDRDGPPFAPWLDPVASLAHRVAAGKMGRGGRHRGGRHRKQQEQQPVDPAAAGGQPQPADVSHSAEPARSRAPRPADALRRTGPVAPGAHRPPAPPYPYPITTTRSAAAAPPPPGPASPAAPEHPQRADRYGDREQGREPAAPAAPGTPVPPGPGLSPPDSSPPWAPPDPR